MNTRCGGTDPFRAAVNTISIPPGEYDREVATKKDGRGPAQAVDYVV